MNELGGEEIANLRTNVENLAAQLNQLQTSLEQIRLAVTGRTNNENVVDNNVNPIIQTHKMDPYSGEKETFPSYLQKFNAYCRLSNIPDNQKLDTLILHLRGRAMDLLMANENARSSFAEAVNFLERNFKGGTSLLAAHTKLDNITCMKPENFVSSAEEIGKLIDQIYISDSEDIRLQKKLTRISLLLPLELRTTLEFMNVDVFETAIHRGHKMWMNYEQAKKSKTRENKSYKENQRFQGKCSNCNKEGHMAKNCRLLKNNDNISKNNPSTAKSQFSGSCVELQESKNIHDLPIIKVFINDLVVPALLDSGSTISMISQSLANKLNLNVVKGNNFVRSFNGSYHKPNMCLEDLTITIGTHSFTWKPLIMEATENEHIFNVLLGCDFFKDKNIKFCFVKGERRITINGQSTSCINNLNIHKQPSCRIKSKRVSPVSTDEMKENCEIISKTCETNVQIKDDLRCDDSSKEMDDSSRVELNVSENENSKLDLKSNNLPVLCNMALFENKNHIYHEEISKRFPNLLCKHKFDVGPGILKVPDQVIIENVDIKKNVRFPSRTDKENETINSYINQMVNADILEKGYVPYIHPLYCIPKPGPTEELRVVADLRSINAQTVPFNFESELSREMFARLSQAKKISKLDMNNAYYQLSLSEKMYKYFGVQGPSGCYFFKRLPQGAKNSSMLFNATLENLLLPFKNNVLLYCDDIVIYSGENDNHFEIVMSILNKFSEASLRINISKCNFECSRITFLGFQISPEGISPSEESLQRFKKRRKPVNTKELRSLLLSCNYFRGNIHKFVDLSQPLMEICPSKGSKRIEWNPTLDKQYEALVEAVQNAETIYYPDYSLPFYITSDACQYGIGAYLSQFHGNSEKILGYFSKKIDSTVKARNPTFTEAISLREAIYYFKPITRGHLTYLRTDHKNLINIVNNGNNARYGTFIEAVESGNYKICYINALNNPVADDLSRYGVVNTIIDEKLLPRRILTKEIQLADDDIKSGLESNEYILENDLIMFEKEGEKLPVIPRDVIKDILFIAHDQSGHYSFKKTLDTISNKCFFKSMKKIIYYYCKTCHECQLRNISPTVELDDKDVIYTKPNECIAIDICGKISPASNSYCYVLGIIDCFSRFVTLIPLRQYDYSSVSKALFHQYFYIHGLPSQVYVDGGGNFKNQKLKKMMMEMNVNLTNTIPYYSKSNTIIERMFKQMQNCIAKYDGEWSELLPACAYYHNVMEHSTTEKSPYYLHFLREPNTGLDMFIKKANINEIDYDQDKTNLQAYAIQAYKIAENAIKKNRNFKEIEDKIIFKPGEEVLVLKKQNRNKFDYRYEGPFIIKSTDQRNANLYRSPGGKIFTRHVSQLKRYFRRGENGESCKKIIIDTCEEKKCFLFYIFDNNNELSKGYGRCGSLSTIVFLELKALLYALEKINFDEFNDSEELHIFSSNNKLCKIIDPDCIDAYKNNNGLFQKIRMYLRRFKKINILSTDSLDQQSAVTLLMGKKLLNEARKMQAGYFNLF